MSESIFNVRRSFGVRNIQFTSKTYIKQSQEVSKSLNYISNKIQTVRDFFLSYQDFSQFLFGWYIREHKQGRLLQQFRGIERPGTHQQALSQFLVDHPSLSWLQNVFTGDYRQASSTLNDLARRESELLQRKKVVLFFLPHGVRSRHHVSLPDFLMDFSGIFVLSAYFKIGLLNFIPVHICTIMINSYNKTNQMH